MLMCMMPPVLCEFVSAVRPGSCLLRKTRRLFRLGFRIRGCRRHERGNVGGKVGDELVSVGRIRLSVAGEPKEGRTPTSSSVPAALALPIRRTLPSLCPFACLVGKFSLAFHVQDRRRPGDSNSLGEEKE